MIKARSYFLVFSLSTVIFVAVFFVILLFFIGSLMFITWSLPAALPFTWPIFRLLVSMGTLAAFCFTVSKEGRSLANDFAKSFNNKGYDT